MKAACFTVVVILTSFLASPAFGDDLVVQESSDVPLATPATPVQILSSCERLVLRGLQMVLYRDRESGELATVKFEPNWSLGGEVGLTYRF